MELKLRHVTKEIMANPREYVGRILYVYMWDDEILEKHNLYYDDDKSRWLLDSCEYYLEEFDLDPHLDIFELDVIED